MAFTLTEKAAVEVKRVMESQQLEEGTVLRLRITGGGCGGFSYGLGFDKSYDESTDTKYDQHGIATVTDKKSALYLDGATIDFVEAQGRQGFTFDNPNEFRACSGCGSARA